MSIKENINLVKEELNSEEKFLESFIKFERFYKKNRILIISVLSIVIIFIGYINIIDYQNKINKKESNIAFDKFLKNKNDINALDILKNNNERLFELANYIKAKEVNQDLQIGIDYFKELSEYHHAMKTQNIKKLDSLTVKNNFLLQEWALFNKALILTNTKQYLEAKKTLQLIPKESKVNNYVILLKHYLMTK